MNKQRLRWLLLVDLALSLLSLLSLLLLIRCVVSRESEKSHSYLFNSTKLPFKHHFHSKERRWNWLKHTFHAGRFLNRSATKICGSKTTRTNYEAMLSAGAHVNRLNWHHCMNYSEWNVKISIGKKWSGGSVDFVSFILQQIITFNSELLTEWRKKKIINNIARNTHYAIKVARKKKRQNHEES